MLGEWIMKKVDEGEERFVVEGVRGRGKREI